MIGKKNGKKPDLHHIDLFHDSNIYLPTRTVYFGGTPFTLDEVDSVSVAQVIKNLQILEHREIAPISFVLNSCGGSWFDGVAIYDVIKALKSPVTIIGLGQLFSMGSVIFQAGDKRVLSKHTTMMIHDGSDGYIGESKNYENWAGYSKKIRHQMYQIYYQQMKKKNSKITLKKIENLCANDNILSAEKAIKLGLADEIIGDE